MNAVSPSIDKESPKTPGGISKSLLTPCRRIGLSRKWRKGGCSPFISPLSISSQATQHRSEDEKEKKRKKYDNNDHATAKEKLDTFHESNSPVREYKIEKPNNINLTPCRNTQILKKKAKVLSLSSRKSQEAEKDDLANEIRSQANKQVKMSKSETNETDISEDITLNTERYKEIKNIQSAIENVKEIKQISEQNVLKLVRAESKKKKLSLKKSLFKTESNINSTESQLNDSLENTEPAESSNNLTKECIAVIQNKILKNYPHITSNETENDSQKSNPDPDININTFDDDFLSKPIKRKFKNLSTIKVNTVDPEDSSKSTQSSQEDMDKRTILVKKTYEKVAKPQKAKSIGSITQQDIDALKTRIKMKQKLLLAKTMTTDTEELCSLIKKWQKGCQNALKELLDLIKKKMPDKQNIDYAEILETLKIPAQIVGYDS